MNEFVQQYGWYLVWAMTVAIAWLHGNNRATGLHIASLEKHADWLRSHADEFNAADAILTQPQEER